MSPNMHTSVRYCVIAVFSVSMMTSLTFLISQSNGPYEGTGSGGWMKNGYVLRAIAPCEVWESSQKAAGIPRIIHQIWRDEILPSALADNVRGLADNHPDWEYYFWTDEAGQKLIEDKYPFLLNLYRAEHVPKHAGLFGSDILRYVVLHEFGGVYFDLDTVSLRPLDPFIKTTDCSLVEEPGEHYFFFNVDIILSNAAMLCEKEHPFLKQILYHIMTMDKTCFSAMHCTGPLLVTDIYKELNKSGNMLAKLPDVHSSEVFMDVYDHPLQGARLERVCRNLTSTALTKSQKDICSNWINRGKGARQVSEKAYSYHRWYHLKYHKNRFSTANNVTLLVPRVKIYGRKDFDRHSHS